MPRQLPVVEGRIRWLVVALVAGAILIASITRPTGLRGAVGPLGVVGFDKWLHGVAYAALAMALTYALAEREAAWAAVAVFLAAMTFGLGVELLQAAIPYREFSALDLVANGVGATIVAVAWRAVAPRLRVRPRPVLGEA